MSSQLSSSVRLTITETHSIKCLLSQENPSSY